MRAFINSLEPAYTLPSRERIGGNLLIECYNEIRAQVLENIRNNDFINVSIDESSTTVRERVINYCVMVKSGCFCMKQATVEIGPSIAES
jgi:hypothetical protein